MRVQMTCSWPCVVVVVVVEGVVVVVVVEGVVVFVHVAPFH